MQYEILKTLIIVFLYVFITYAISRSLWIIGIKGKAKTFGKFWGAIALLIGGVFVGVGLIFLIKLF